MGQSRVAGEKKTASCKMNTKRKFPRDRQIIDRCVPPKEDHRTYIELEIDYKAVPTVSSSFYPPTYSDGTYSAC